MSLNPNSTILQTDVSTLNVEETDQTRPVSNDQSSKTNPEADKQANVRFFYQADSEAHGTKRDAKKDNIDKKL